MSLRGKIALVTGGSRGIGRAISLRLARDGALVAINYRNDAEAAHSAVAEIEAAGGEAFAIQGDVSSVADLGRFFEALDAELIKRRGDNYFDILFNNAGVGGPGLSLEEATEEAFDRVFDTNVKGPFFVLKHALSRLRDGGRVINVSSKLSQSPAARALVYCMTKAAIDNFTLALADPLGTRGITVNTLAPGLTRTELNSAIRSTPGFEASVEKMTALGRIGEVDDIASAAAFLASNDSAWVTGVYLEASGGLGLAMRS